MQDAIQTNPAANQLALTCLAHMQQEEAMLNGSLQILRDIRGALLQRNLETLVQAVQQQQHTAQAAADLRVSRSQLREKISQQLGVDESQATFAAVTQIVASPMRQRLVDCRQRLRGMALEVNHLNQGNAVLIRQSMDLLQALLVSLTGGDAESQRYAASGQLQRGQCGSMFQARL